MHGEYPGLVPGQKLDQDTKLDQSTAGQSKSGKVLHSPKKFRNEHDETLAILNELSKGLTLEGVPAKLGELEAEKIKLEKQKADLNGSAISKLTNIISIAGIMEQDALQRRIQDIELLIERLERINRTGHQTRGKDLKAA